jgi:tyrosinase
MADDMTRREFAYGTLLTGGVALIEGKVHAQQPPAQQAPQFTRYSAYDPPAGLDSYRRGVEKMMEWSKANQNDTRGWTFQAGLHGSLMAGQFFNQCEHASWWFFPWHRAYLYFFERIVRKASGDDKFALPYWDWNVEGRRSLPPAFRDLGSKLFDNTRGSDVNEGEPLPGRDIDPTKLERSRRPASSEQDQEAASVVCHSRPARRGFLRTRPTTRCMC